MDKNSDFNKGNHLATLNPKEIDKFKFVDVQHNKIVKQMSTLRSLEVDTMALHFRTWDGIIKKYDLPTINELAAEGLWLRLDYSSGRVIVDKVVEDRSTSQ